MASDYKTDLCCGSCGAVLMQAAEGQIHHLLIQCTWCSSVNSTDGFSD
jgi:phage FluMu protein Com